MTDTRSMIVRPPSGVNDRLGDMFLRLADAPPPNADTRARASALMGRLLEEANAALRENFVPPRCHRMYSRRCSGSNGKAAHPWML